MSKRNVSAPAAITSVVTTKKPQITSTKIGTRVKHTELLSRITGTASATFVPSIVRTFQPALAGEPPSANDEASCTDWLASLGSVFEEYEVHSCSITYVPKVGTNTAGSLYMAIDYNPGDEVPLTERTFMEAVGAISSSVWAGCSLAVDPAAIKPRRKYTRTGNEVGDVKLFDAFRFFGALDGATNGVVYGTFYISYDVSFYVPQSAYRPPVNQTTTYMPIPSVGIAPAATQDLSLTPPGAGYDGLNVINTAADLISVPNCNFLAEASLSLGVAAGFELYATVSFFVDAVEYCKKVVYYPPVVGSAITPTIDLEWLALANTLARSPITLKVRVINNSVTVGNTLTISPTIAGSVSSSQLFLREA